METCDINLAVKQPFVFLFSIAILIIYDLSFIYYHFCYYMVLNFMVC